MNQRAVRWVRWTPDDTVSTERFGLFFMYSCTASCTALNPRISLYFHVNHFGSEIKTKLWFKRMFLPTLYWIILWECIYMYNIFKYFYSICCIFLNSRIFYWFWILPENSCLHFYHIKVDNFLCVTEKMFKCWIKSWIIVKKFYCN